MFFKSWTYQIFSLNFMFYFLEGCKVCFSVKSYILRRSHNFRNLHRRFDCYYMGQINGGDFIKKSVVLSEYMNAGICDLNWKLLPWKKPKHLKISWKKILDSGIVKKCDELDLRLCNTNGTVVHLALPLQGVQIIQSNLSKNEKKSLN